MEKAIKTKEAHDTCVKATEKAKQAALKAKKSVSENTAQPVADAPEEYAADKVTQAEKTVAEASVLVTEKAVRKAAKTVKGKVKENGTKSKTPEKEKSPSANKQTEVDGEARKTGSTKGTEKAEAISEPKTEQSSSKKKPEKHLRQREKASPKLHDSYKTKAVRRQEHTIQHTQEASIKMKQAPKGKATQKSAVKTADRTAKTAKKSAQAAKKSAEATAKTAKQAEKAARATAKATVKTAKAAAKVVVEAAKATAEAVKGLATLIASGGVVAVVVVVVICLIAVIGGTCFGIFLSNDDSSGSQMTMTSAMQEVTSDFYAEMTALKLSFTYDSFEVSGGDISIDWKAALAVYAVKTTTSSGDAYEVVTLDETKLQLLEETVKDMNKIMGVVTVEVVPVTTVVTDENGDTTTSVSYESKRVLTATVTHLTMEQAAILYGFSDEQKSQLAEITGSEYDALWAELLSGSGEVLISDGSWQPNDIFVWPFESDHPISSPFGTRTDPITGETKTHGGTDISAGLGTPILAAADGVVELATWHNSYGYYVRIRHNDTYKTLYAHSSSLLVSAGQAVKQGQVIALVGSTGRSTGPHLHFEVIQNGIRVNPMNFFS